MRVEIPTAPKFYPPANGDVWGDGSVEAWGKNHDGTYWVRVRYADGVGNFARCPVDHRNRLIGNFEFSKRA